MPLIRFAFGALVALCLISSLATRALADQPPSNEKREPDEVVQFPSFQNDVTLDGYVWLPEGDGPFAAIVAMHGCGGVFIDPGDTTPDRIAGKFRYWGKQLADEGFVVVMVDSFVPRGYGDDVNDGEVCDTPWQDRPAEIDGVTARPFDAYAALDYVRSRNDVDPSRVGLLGWSNGGSATLSGVSNVDGSSPLLEPGVDFFTDPANQDLMRHEGFYAAAAIYPGCGLQNVYPNDFYENYSDLLVFIGDSDTAVDPMNCVELVAEAQTNGSDAELFLYAGEGHGYDYDESDGAAAGDTRARVYEHFAAGLGVIFVDGFEDGTTGAWSFTQ
jgi:carboxymethylenebutenolidase